MTQAASNEPASPQTKSYLTLIALGEPFRLLFPLGTLLGILGVLLWPLFAWNLLGTYPGVIHPKIMIEGFLTSFVIGFLGTALPRLLDVPRLTLAETLVYAWALAMTTLLHLFGKVLGGDLLFFFTLLAFMTGLAVRAFFRKDNPPPAFVLVVMGLLSALLGVAIQLITSIAPEAFPLWAVPFGKLLLHQSYLLLPIMGVGAFLLPRFFGLPNNQNFPESLAFSADWKRRAAFALGCGLGVIVSFLLEANGLVRAAYVLRATLVLLYFGREVPVHQAGFGGGSLALALRVALLAIPAGFLLIAIWPERAYSFLHVVFITGFSLLTFVVASRVILGHGGQSDLFRSWLKSILILAACLTIAMLTRVSADWFPEARTMHYAYAAVAWIVGVLLWAVAILPFVRVAEQES